MDELNFLMDFLDNNNKIDIKRCECGLILTSICMNCGMTNNEIELIVSNTNLYDNYKKHNKTKYSRYKYMKLYLLSFTNVNIPIYNDDVYNYVIEKYKSIPFETSFKTYFHRLKMFDKSEYISFKYFKDHQDNINMDSINDTLKHSIINKISLHYDKIKFPNRNLFIYYYYPEVYKVLKSMLHMTEATKKLYMRKFNLNEKKA